MNDVGKTKQHIDIYILDLHMTPSGVILIVKNLLAKNLAWAKKNTTKMETSVRRIP